MSLDIDFAGEPTGFLSGIAFCEAEGSMTETSSSNGNEGLRILYVAWDDRRSAMETLRGSTIENPTNPNRPIVIPPLSFPGNVNLVCKTVIVVGITQITETTNEAINYKYAELRCTYRSGTTDDDQVTSTNQLTATVEFMEIDGSSIAWNSNKPVTDPLTGALLGVRVATISITYVQERFELPPNYLDFIGTINDRDYQGYKPYTLLFSGLESREIVDTAGDTKLSITYHFLARPRKPWNLFFDKDRPDVESTVNDANTFPVDNGWFPVYGSVPGGNPVLWPVYGVNNFHDLGLFEATGPSDPYAPGSSSSSSSESSASSDSSGP